MIKLCTSISFLFFQILLHAQHDEIIDINSKNKNMITKVSGNESINYDSMLNKLSHWNKYREIKKVNQNYIFYFDDPYFKKIPFRLFIPESYRNDIKTPLILLLHGAVQVSSFERVNKYVEDGIVNDDEDDDDLFFKYLSKQGYIIVRPFADKKRRFSWVINEFNDLFHSTKIDEGVNLTYKTLVNVIIKLKQILNIDDSRIYTVGHSDGADGAFCMELFQPNIFAGFVIYNSLLANLNATNIYLRNAKNRPMYIVHSDLDDIRPIEQTKAIVDIIKETDTSIVYKEYKGYKHFDKHLILDLPFANKFMLQTIRNPYSKNKYLESNNYIDNQCDWLKVDSFDLNLPKSEWQVDLNINIFNKNNKQWVDHPYYLNSGGYAIKGDYNNNIFKIETSRVKNFEILISNRMVDINKPISVYVNGKLEYNKIVKPNKKYIMNSFETNFDREVIWVNSIKIYLKNN
jgi:predicted esterase